MVAPPPTFYLLFMPSPYERRLYGGLINMPPFHQFYCISTFLQYFLGPRIAVCIDKLYWCCPAQVGSFLFMALRCPLCLEFVFFTSSNFKNYTGSIAFLDLIISIYYMYGCVLEQRNRSERSSGRIAFSPDGVLSCFFFLVSSESWLKLGRDKRMCKSSDNIRFVC